MEWCELLDLNTVPVLFDGHIKDLDCKFSDVENSEFDGINIEGYVMRIAEEFKMRDFKKSVAKYVGEGFVLPHGHWTSSWTKNTLSK